LVSLEQTATDKALKREVRRSLFKLSQKGLSASQPEPTEQAPERPIFKLSPDVEGYLSAVDEAGNRMVWLAKPRAGSGVGFIHGIVNDREGMTQVDGLVIRRKELRNMIAGMKEKHGMTMVPIPWEYGDLLLYEAYEKAKAMGRSGLEQFPALRAHLNAVKPGPRVHPVYDSLNPEEIRSGPWRETSQKLLAEPEFRAWVLAEDWLSPYLERVQGAQESRLVLNRMQQEQRLMGLVRDAVRELFSEECGRLFSGRMEDMALYLLLTDRENQAKSALAVAIALRNKDLGGLGVPFLEGLVQKSLAIHTTQEEEKQKQEETSLIIKP
jgi:hypothetical protein